MAYFLNAKQGKGSMFKTIISATILCSVSACSVIPTISIQSEQYPKVYYSDYAGIEKKLSLTRMPNQQEKAILAVVRKALDNEPLTSGEVDRVNFQLRDLAEMREAASAEFNRTEQAKRDEEARKEALRNARVKDAAERQVEDKWARYRQEFSSIRSPDDAEVFVLKYKGPGEPGDLTSKAMAKGLKEGIASAQNCIDYSNKVIRRQKEIGNEVGYVDKYAVYQAGSSLVACRKQLAIYKLESQK
jgi:hypothetical protein